MAELTANACSTCLTRASGISFINLSCGHRFCYKCFITLLIANLSQIFKCKCEKPIADDEVEHFLLPDDFIAFLKHQRDNLRRVIRLHDLEANFLDISSQSSEETIIVNETEVTGRRSELIHLTNLDSKAFAANPDEFECGICFAVVAEGEGVMLKNCLHCFCRECITSTVEHATDPEVACPHNSELGSCEFFIQDREIRALVPAEIYEKHLTKALERAETNLQNVFHCKFPDCHGFAELAPDVNAFACQVCEKVNCIKCQTIHEEKTCEQYQFDLVNDAKNQRELKLTEQAVQAMLQKGEVRK
jgi:hypothetical protein